MHVTFQHLSIMLDRVVRCYKGAKCCWNVYRSTQYKNLQMQLYGYIHRQKLFRINSRRAEYGRIP